MLSGNGRHRRPRQAPAIVVAAGVTGSAIAIPLLGAASAHAVDASTWEVLAECESDGSWTAITGNGHYGGLQLTQEEWVAHDGLKYALSPDRATRAQQITVAERLLEEKDPEVIWPGCATLSGLNANDGPGSSGSGSSESPSPAPSPSSSSSSSSSSSAEPSPSDSASPSPSESAGTPDDDSSDGASPAPSDSAPEGTGDADGEAGGGAGRADGGGRHRGGAAHEGSDGRDGTDGSGGRHASRGDSGERDGAYTVQPGDNLWDIAEAHDLDGGWTALYAANKKVVGEDPDLILPGQHLDLTR